MRVATKPVPLPTVTRNSATTLSVVGRSRAQARALDDQARALLAEDARYFLHQSLSTPCLNALAAAEGVYLPDLQGRRYLDFHGNNVHQVGFGNPDVIAAVKRQLDELPFCTRRYTNQVAVDLARQIFEDLAHFEVMRRRYREATPLLRKAIEIQPDLWSAHADLGANLLRQGEIEEARAHLQTAYGGDPYSQTTVNTLRLLDRVNEIEVTSTKFVLPATTDAPQSEVEVRLRLHRKEAQALYPYVFELTRNSVETFAQRYGYRPVEPLTVILM